MNTSTWLTALVLTLTTSAAMAVEHIHPPYSWRGINSSGVFPAGGLVDYFMDVPEGAKLDGIKNLPSGAKPGVRKNIVWRTLLPHYGFNAPVVVGDKVFVMTDPGWKDDAVQLLCLSAVSGEILWQRPVDHLDAWPKSKASSARALRSEFFDVHRRAMQWWNKVWWDNESNTLIMSEQLSGARQQAAQAAQKGGFDMTKYTPRSGFKGIRGRVFWKYAVDPKVRELYKKVSQERIFTYEGWTTEGPWYGSSMGSVVSDGKCVYAITAQDAAVCYDLDGKLKWVTDMEGSKRFGTHSGFAEHNQMASPVLVDGHLVYHYYNYSADKRSIPPQVIGMSAKTGKVAWRVSWPYSDSMIDKRKKGWGNKPQGYHAHMAPGGTPVVMRLSDTAVVVANGGMVVRVSDGKNLGFVRVPKPEGYEGKDTSGPYQSTYNSWTAQGDVLYAQRFSKYIVAIRLGLKGDSLEQKVLWHSDDAIKTDNRNMNLAIFDGKLFGSQWVKKNALGMLDQKTGKLLKAGGGQGIGGYMSAMGLSTDGTILIRTSDWNARGKGTGTFAIIDAKSLSTKGSGFLAHPPKTKELMQRHISVNGWNRMNWTASGMTCWGNRYFIRSGDYIWCIGDPKKKYVPPEKFLK